MVVDSGRIQNHRPPHNNHSNNTLHTLVVEWSIFKTSRVRARDIACACAREFRESLPYSMRLLSIPSRPHPVNLQTISRLLRTLKGDNSHQVSETYG